jgi:polysaccharide deacetylase family protein (PEP-CTERM system associated)
VQFRDDITHAKRLLEDLGGVAVRGYRAPSYSIGCNNWWAVAELEDAWLRVQFQHLSGAPRPLRHARRAALSAPPEWRLGHSRTAADHAAAVRAQPPAAGGGWFRLLPYELSRWMLRRVNAQEQAPCMFYFHPWELDAEQPRQHGISAKTRFRQYVNLQRMPGRLRNLLNDFEWDRVDRVFLPAIEHAADRLL